jgi:hypothetical protein
MAIICPAETAVERLITGVLGCSLLPLVALDTALTSDARPHRNRKLPARFRRRCRPLATPATPGAFLFGLLLLTLDGSHLDLPDTPVNERACVRRPTPRGRSAWSQALVVLLVECGARAVCDGGVWPGLADARRAGRRLLRSTGPGTLVLWDRGFQNVAMVAAVQARGADFLGRLPATVRPVPAQGLADGTPLVRLRPCDHSRRYHGAHIVVRLIRDTLDDPQRPGHRLEHRLVTALLDPSAAPARELIRAYHRLPLPAAAPGRG